jgi:hypothetical protein
LAGLENLGCIALTSAVAGWTASCNNHGDVLKDPDTEAAVSNGSENFSANVKCPTALSSAATAINEICRVGSGPLFQSERCDQALATLIDVLSESCITDD